MQAKNNIYFLWLHIYTLYFFILLSCTVRCIKYKSSSQICENRLFCPTTPTVCCCSLQHIINVCLYKAQYYICFFRNIKEDMIWIWIGNPITGSLSMYLCELFVHKSTTMYTIISAFIYFLLSSQMRDTVHLWSIQLTQLSIQ